MPEIGTSGLMSGDGKRGDGQRPKLPRPSSTLPQQTSLHRSKLNLTVIRSPRQRGQGASAGLPQPPAVSKAKRADISGYTETARTPEMLFTRGRQTPPPAQSSSQRKYLTHPPPWIWDT